MLPPGDLPNCELLSVPLAHTRLDPQAFDHLSKLQNKSVYQKFQSYSLHNNCFGASGQWIFDYRGRIVLQSLKKSPKEFDYIILGNE